MDYYVWGCIVFGYLVLVMVIGVLVSNLSRIERQEDISIIHGMDLKRLANRLYDLENGNPAAESRKTQDLRGSRGSPL